MPPSLLLAAMLSTSYSALFHLLRGGDMRRLGLLMLAGWVGFALGQLAGLLIDWNGAMLGEIHLIESTIGTLLALVFVSRPSA